MGSRPQKRLGWYFSGDVSETCHKQEEEEGGEELTARIRGVNDIDNDMKYIPH